MNNIGKIYSRKRFVFKPLVKNKDSEINEQKMRNNNETSFDIMSKRGETEKSGFKVNKRNDGDIREECK